MEIREMNTRMADTPVDGTALGVESARLLAQHLNERRFIFQGNILSKGEA